MKRSPIKYYGGKFYMVKYILNEFPKEYKVYVEGFAGSAIILLNKERTPLEVYNDINENVYALFKCLQDKELFKKLKHKLELTPYHDKFRLECRELLKTHDLSLLDRAYCFFINNKMSFNSVGGFSTSLIIRNQMPLPVSGYLSTIDGLEEIYNRLRTVIIESRDIFDLIKKYDKKDTFFYLDPPYIHSTRSSTQKYPCEMSDDEHIQLVKVLNNLKGKYLLSGYEHEIYDELNYKNKITFEDKHKLIKREVLWKNY